MRLDELVEGSLVRVQQPVPVPSSGRSPDGDRPSGPSPSSAPTAGIALLVRPVKTTTATTTGQRPVRLRDEFRIFGRGQVLASALISRLVSGGVVGSFTYIAFLYTDVSHISDGTIPWLLLFGVGTFLGNALGGKLADRSIDRTLLMFVPALAVVATAFALTAQVPALAVILTGLMGVVAFTNLPGMQLRIMSLAGDAPTMASGVNIAALNIGNAAGDALRGLVLSTSLLVVLGQPGPGADAREARAPNVPGERPDQGSKRPQRNACGQAYLRSRGEHHPNAGRYLNWLGSPPLARRALRRSRQALGAFRLTSARAETTADLRSRGELAIQTSFGSAGNGSPSLARRARRGRGRRTCRRRLTSARAKSTWWMSWCSP
ncbi:MFS transporter [Streptomyces parvus]|uniref:MFS transporter n=1 Tax=Streptomyces parvus TaxID=66428 RepID=UPI0036536FEA